MAVLTLLAGVAGSVRQYATHRDVLPALLAAEDGAGWGYANLQPTADWLASRLPAGASVSVLSETPDPWIWLRYLAYPLAVDWLPLEGLHRHAAQALPPGESWLVLALQPGGRADESTRGMLKSRLGAADVELVLDDPAGAPVYRLRR